MGNVCSCLKKNQFDDNNPLLNNNMYCAYCDKTYPFNVYHRHLVECKRINLKNNEYGG